MMETHHILDAKKKQIETNLAALFGQVTGALEQAVECLNTRDNAICERIIRDDILLNERRRMVEQDCLVAIASQQPVANDLRDIVADMRIASELERMGDYASDIAAAVLQLSGNDLDQLALADILAMSASCRTMVADAMKAHADDDLERARGLAAQDDALDASLRKIIDHVLATMRNRPELVDDGSRLLWIAHNLERCGDRATNIAEQVTFRIRGEIEELN
jgi:phosphate transport system protein